MEPPQRLQQTSNPANARANTLARLFERLPYGLSFLFALLSLLGFHQGGWFTYSAVFLFFILHPVLDNFVFPDAKPPGCATERVASPQPEFAADFFLYLALPTLSAVLVWGFFHASQVTLYEFIGLTLSSATLTSVLGINVAHELVHRRSQWQRALGVYLLSLAHFAHWGIAHVSSHHKHVATPADSATARRGETLYHFWFRAYLGGWHEAYLFERKKSFLSNRIWQYLFFSGASFISVQLLFGWQALSYWFLQSLIAIFLLETVDYLEHYGLTRKEIRKSESPVNYEAFRAEHAWDSSRAFTNFALVNLALHSHHHLKTSLPYQELQIQATAQKMPYGYSLMALMALIPPLYFSRIHPLLDARDLASGLKSN